MNRRGRAVAVAIGLIAVFLIILAFWWNGWAGETAFVLGVATLMIDGSVALVCRIRRDTYVPMAPTDPSSGSPPGDLSDDAGYAIANPRAF